MLQTLYLDHSQKQLNAVVLFILGLFVYHKSACHCWISDMLHILLCTSERSKEEDASITTHAKRIEFYRTCKKQIKSVERWLQVSRFGLAYDVPNTLTLDWFCPILAYERSELWLQDQSQAVISTMCLSGINVVPLWPNNETEDGAFLNYGDVFVVHASV